MEERRSYEQANGGMGECNCRPFDETHLRNTTSIRRLIKALEEELLEGPPPEPGKPRQRYEPTEATKKLGDELKDFDKEYQGLAGIVSSYEKFFDKLECRLAEARTWGDQLDEVLKDRPDQKTKEAIKKLREVYEAEEKRTGSCCKWIGYRDMLDKQGDCLARALRDEEEAKEDNEAFKGFEKTLTDRFGELKSLFDRLEALSKAEKFNSLYAVALEFADVYKNLGVVVTWAHRRKKCEKDEQPQEPYGGGREGGGYGEGGGQQGGYEPGGGGQQGGYEQGGSQQGGYEQGGGQQGGYGREEYRQGGEEGNGYGGEAEKYRPKVMKPEAFKEELDKALRELILSKYQRFRWHQKRLEIEIKTKNFKDMCEKFRKGRREEFIQEAEDAQPAPSGATSEADAVKKGEERYA